MKNSEEIIKELQQVVEQMRIDDIEESPESETELFTCGSCAKEAPYAGSVQYGKYRLCNECVLLAEIGFALDKFENIQDMIDKMEDRRLEEICDFIEQDKKSQNN